MTVPSSAILLPTLFAASAEMPATWPVIVPIARGARTGATTTGPLRSTAVPQLVASVKAMPSIASTSHSCKNCPAVHPSGTAVLSNASKPVPAATITHHPPATQVATVTSSPGSVDRQAQPHHGSSAAATTGTAVVRLPPGRPAVAAAATTTDTVRLMEATVALQPLRELLLGTSLPLRPRQVAKAMAVTPAILVVITAIMLVMARLRVLLRLRLDLVRFSTSTAVLVAHHLRLLAMLRLR